MTKAIFIGATGQDVGKTTVCLGIISGLMKRFSKVGFTKPVGQMHQTVSSGQRVDKDAVLFKDRFDLNADWKSMSPVIVPKGFTKDYIDGKVDSQKMLSDILTAFKKISSENDYTVVEGTGHIGVGSIIEMNNAKVASLLGLEMVITVTGGLGSAIDELAINIAMCEKYNVRVRGVILNRVYEDKRAMITDYASRALKKWDIPLIGVIPFDQFLTTPTMGDFEALFDTKMLCCKTEKWRHFNQIRLVAGAINSFEEEFDPNELIVTPSSRENIIEKILELAKEGLVCRGMILTGRKKPSETQVQALEAAQIPMLFASINSYDAMREITHLSTKTQSEDTAKVDEAIHLVEPFINFNYLI